MTKQNNNKAKKKKKTVSESQLRGKVFPYGTSLYATYNGGLLYSSISFRFLGLVIANVYLQTITTIRIHWRG